MTVSSERMCVQHGNDVFLLLGGSSAENVIAGAIFRDMRHDNVLKPIADVKHLPNTFGRLFLSISKHIAKTLDIGMKIKERRAKPDITMEKISLLNDFVKHATDIRTAALQIDIRTKPEKSIKISNGIAH